MSYGFYVYGIFSLPAPQNLSIQGLDQKPVKIEVIDDFAVLYSEAQQERYLASRRNLLGHEKVLEEVMQAGYRDLLPLQFGLRVSEWETVSQQLLRLHQEELVRLLNKLSGHREVGIKVFWDVNAEIQELLTQNSELKSQRDSLVGQALSLEQTIQIGRLIEQGVEIRKQDIINIFENTLNSIAVEIVENPPQTENMIYNSAYLIPWDAEPEFSRKVETLDAQFERRLRIRYNNFTAPFNFARLTNSSVAVSR